MSIRKGNDIIASKPLIDAVPTQSSTNAVSSGGVYDALATKQATISDLATIRSGAAAGATAVQPGDLATVATTGNYNDLSNKPTIPAAQVNSDWNAVSGVAQILNKPTTLSGYGITDGANTDLSNLTSTGANIGNWSHNVTNCITEIPQDIKLELNNGTLTLKAGSKVYVPNGVGVFDEVTVASDLTLNGASATGKELIYLTADGTTLYHYLDNSSGTNWTATSQYECRYNTSDNMIKNTNDNGSTWLTQVSFPIALITLSSGTVTNIDQVFNGFGYIGSTVFALPGVKGLIPNGRNDDGTLKSTPFEVENVLISGLFTGSWSGEVYIKSDKITYTNTTVYDEAQNITIDSGNYITAGAYCLLGYHITTNGKVVLRPKSVFHAFDYDTEFIGHQSKPNNKYVDITYGANGAVYLMPADGYLDVGVTHPDNANWEGMGIDVLDANSNFLFNVGGTYNLNNQAYWFLVPVSKNFRVQIWINGFSFNRLRFIYANGSV